MDAAAQRMWLLALSGLSVLILELLRLPAAPLLGPMVAGIVVAASEGTVRLISRRVGAG